MKKFLMLATAAIVASAAIPAIAADATTETPAAKTEAPAEASKDAPHGGPGHMKGRGMFDRGDTNKDGVVTKDEFLAQSEEAFKALDTDGDGKITKAEVEEKRKKFNEMREKRRKQAADGHAAPPAADEKSE